MYQVLTFDFLDTKLPIRKALFHRIQRLVLFFHTFLTLSPIIADGSSARGSVSGEEEWSEDMEEPEMEFDEMGLELAAQDGKPHYFILL